MGCGMWVKLHLSGMHLEGKPNLLGVDLDKFVLPQPASVSKELRPTHTVHSLSIPKESSVETQTPLQGEPRISTCMSNGDYIDGKLPHFEMPPGMSNNEAGLEVADAPSSSEMHESDSSDTKNPPSSEDEENTPNLEHVLNYLNSFDMANGLCFGKVPAKKKRENASHKQHRKPQTKKYRSWRVGGEDGDGMPVVRVFQKPANTGPLKVG